MRLKAAPGALPYIFAIAVTAAAVAVRWLLDRWLGWDLSLVTLFPAVAACVWFGGYRPALLTALLGYVACNTLFIAPRGEFGLYSTRDLVGCIMFILSSAILIGFGEALRVARRRADVVLNEAQRMAHAGSWQWTAANDRLVVSEGVRRIFALPADIPVPGFHEQDGVLFPHESWLKLDAVIRGALRTGRGYELDLEAFRGGEPIWVVTRSEVVSDASGKIVGLRGTFQDITERKRAEALQEAQRRILEQIARRVPLPEVLTEVARTVEQQEPGLFCSIHVLDSTGAYLHAGAGPSLPAAYMQAMDAVPVEPADAGPCCEVVQTCRDVLVPDIAADEKWSKRWRTLALASGLRSVRSSIVRAGNGAPLATFAMYRRQPGDPEPTNLQVGFAARQLVAIAVERHLDDAELRRAEADARLLQTLGTELVGEAGERTVYQKVIDGAALLMRSQFASLQSLETFPDGDAELRLLAFRGFSAFAARYWDRVRLMSPTSCAEAMRTRRRAMVADVATCPYLQGTDDLATFRETGIVSVQTTPLISRTGKMVGMLSTHWNRPYTPPERDLRNLDILARQAADLLERKRNEEALREADRRKDEFLATLAHELRNPLAPIRNSLTMMRLAGRPGEAEAGSPAEGGADVAVVPDHLREILERQVHHLIRLVDDLLDVSRITRGKLTLRREPVELEAVVRHAIETIRPLADALGHEVAVDLPRETVWLNADPIRLAQVFNNLLNNACKYSDRKGHVSLMAERLGNEVVVRVRDSGIGIPPERLTNIFDMFTQVDRSLERTQGGLGVGLTLVKRLVDLHGGSVLAQSEGPGRGSEFVVRLPVLHLQAASELVRPRAVAGGALPIREVGATPPAPVPTLAPAPSRTGTTRKTGQAPTASRKVLVVDDNTDAADSLALLLKSSGSVARTAKDGLEALEAAEEFRPDIVFLDIGMPRLNGYDAARRIRQEPWGRDMVLVAMTGWGQDQDRRRSRDAGFDAHIVKPADYSEVVRLVGSTRRAR